MEDATEKVKAVVRAKMLYDLGYDFLDSMEEADYERAQGIINEMRGMITSLEATVDNLQHNIP